MHEFLGSRQRTVATILITVAVSMMAGCYYHAVPVYQPGPSKYDRAWEAARGAADDLGVTITDVNRERGTMLGYKNDADVTITVWQQADGSVQVGFNVRAPRGPDSDLADRLTYAYNRRMGR
jgi:uncharacterized lipoprotein